MRFGTHAWVERTGGRLGRLDRLRLLAQGVRARAAARAAARDDGRRLQALRHVDLDALNPPDTPLMRAAEDLLSAAAQPWLRHHSVRTWYWARLTDDDPGPIDPEALYLACLLHDLGITDSHRPGDGTCFTLVGARCAMRLAQERRWPDARARLAADAIALHLNPVVGARRGREAALLRAGAGADLVGAGLARVAPPTRELVLARHPRLDFKREVDRALRAEAAACPGCRTAFLYGSLGFARLIRAAPFAE